METKLETKDVLKKLRNSEGLSMQQFCEKSDINFSTYQNYETGKRLPTAEMLIKIADFYNVSIDYILCRKSSSTPFGDFELNKNDEAEMMEKYMSLPAEIRASMLDVLMIIGMAAKEKKERQEQLHNKIKQSTEKMITERIVAFGGDNMEREVSEDEIIRRFEALEEENRKRREKREK